MVTAIRKPDLPATRRQLWYLHLLTQEDTREWDMTVQEASDRIQAIRNGDSLEPPPHEMRQVEMAEELASHQVALECDPIARKQIYLGQSKWGKPIYRPLTFFISLREQSFPEYFTVKQATHLLGREPHVMNGRVPKDVALDELSKEFNLSPDEIKERVEAIAKTKRHMRYLESQL